MSREITPGTLSDSDARLLRTPSERRDIYPTAAHEEYARRATAETDRLPIAIAPYNRPLPLHASIKPQPWRPLHDWRFLGCASLGLSLAAFGGYCVGLPSLATLCLVMAGILALNMWRVK
jgi:hypothetical protein